MWFYKLFLKFEPTTTILNDDDDTLPIINKLKHKMEGPMSKKTKKTTSKGKPQGNIKFPNPLLSQKAY
jgi:hypothetical protein